MYMGSNSFAQVQSDDSDSLWSIVMPQYSVKEVDMGKVKVNNYKDSVIINMILNIGNYKSQVESVIFKGSDENSFKLVTPFQKIELHSKQGQNLEIRFLPKKTGKHQSKVYVITKVDTTIVDIFGEGVEPKIEIINNMIDFGTVKIGKHKDTINVVTIKNVSDKSITISDTKHNKPNDLDFSTLDGGGTFTMLPGEVHNMDLSFKPSQVGRTNGTLEFLTNDLQEKMIIQLFGTGVLSPNLLSFSPVCIGDDIVLISDSIPGALYYWSGPDGFYSNNRNVIIKNAQVHHSGKYSLYVVLDGVNSDTLEVDVLVNQYVVTPMDNDLGFRGSTERVENFIKLTNSRDFDYGALWLREKFSFTNDFETTFEFSVSKGSNGTMNEKSIPGADGIAFVIQNRDNPVLGQKGGDIGYTGFANSLAVEIDLYQNEYDPNGNHIAVQSRGYETNTPNHKIMNSLLGLNDKIPIIYQDSIYYVKIRYEWKNKRLQVFINNSPKLDTPELEVYGLDLVDLLNLEEGKYGYIGFTSATGAAYQEHYIYNWIVPCKNNLVSVDDNMEHSFSISVNPNPAIETLNIKLNLAYPTILNLVLCDVNGKIVKNIYDGYYNADLNTEIASDISNLSSGVYFIRFQSAGFTDYQKVIIIK